jgi:phosphoglycerate dehydrogenase-like enzyme
MLILGYGSIGKTIAKAADGFGMKVIGIRRHADAANGDKSANGMAEIVAPVSQLDRYLPDADIVVNMLPLTQDTKHFFDKGKLQSMKKTALYCNMGRGVTTDEEALVASLRNGSIGGAILDVMETEPLPKDSPLWDMNNVILTGHYAGFHPDYDKLALEIAVENMGRYVRNEPLKNLVDKDAGY